MTTQHVLTVYPYLYSVRFVLTGPVHCHYLLSRLAQLVRVVAEHAIVTDPIRTDPCRPILFIVEGILFGDMCVKTAFGAL